MDDIDREIEILNEKYRKLPKEARKKIFFLYRLYNFICIENNYSMDEAIDLLNYLNTPITSSSILLFMQEVI